MFCWVGCGLATECRKDARQHAHRVQCSHSGRWWAVVSRGVACLTGLRSRLAGAVQAFCRPAAAGSIVPASRRPGSGAILTLALYAKLVQPPDQRLDAGTYLPVGIKNANNQAV